MKKKPVRIIRRIVAAEILLITALFFALHYDAREYTAGSEQEFLDRICEMTGNEAVAVGIMDGDEDIYLQHCGITGEQVDEHTLFELGSTTKAFTGLGIMRLEEAGLIRGSDPVTDYIEWFRPQYKGSDAVITIDDLMNHSSGIPVWSISRIPEGGKGEISLEDTVRTIANIDLAHAPGQIHEYATINYDVLALIIETVTGQRYEEYISSTVLSDAGMTDSFFRTCDADRGRIFPGVKDAFFLKWRYDAPTYYGNTAAGYLVSDTSDLVKWMRFVRNNVDFGSFPVTETNNYYAGWNLSPITVHHGGNNPNYGTQIIISRHSDLGVFVLTACDGDAANRIADGIYGMRAGYPARIGMCYTSHELLDLIFVVSTLLVVYVALLLPYKHKKACLGGGVAILAGIVLVPVISHFSYSFLLVWMPFSFAGLMIVTVAFALLLIIRGAAGCFGMKK